jgi:hypothetical protein
MRKVAIAALMALSANAQADIIFDWTGTCRPQSCVRAWGEFRMDDSYVLGSEIAEPGPFNFAHSPKLKGFSLYFDYGWAATKTHVPATQTPVFATEYFIDAFVTDNPREWNLLLTGALPRENTPSLPNRLHLANPEAGDFFFVADYDGGTWGGPFTSKDVAVQTADGFVDMEWDWPTGTDSVFTLRSVPEPGVLALLLGPLAWLGYRRKRD